MGAEKGGAKSSGGLFNLFDWKRKSRKKLFSNSPEGAKLVKRSEESLPSGRLLLIDEEEAVGMVSIKGSSDYSCASSVTDEEGRDMKAPGVVARLMGLDAMPTSGVAEPYCTPFRDTRSFRDTNSLKRSPEYPMNDRYNHMPRRAESYVRKPLELRAQKMPSSPIERFQMEALPPRSAKSLPMPHHRLLSPIKNPGFSSVRNAAQIMEAAAKILEPRPQVSSREKICSYSPARIPSRVCDSRESVPSSQRISRQPQSCRAPLEPPDMRFSGGQQLNQSWNSEEDIIIYRSSLNSYEINNPGCSKGKGKSISLALQAKVNVQKREGLSIPGRNSGAQRERDEFRLNQPFGSQSNPQRNKQQKKQSPGTSSTVLRQNNQKQNSLPGRGKLAANKSVSSQQSRKLLSGDTSSGKHKNVSKGSKVGIRKDIVENTSDDREGSTSNNKDFPQKKRLIERSSTNQKSMFMPEKPVARPEKLVQPNVVMDEHTKWNRESKDTTDVVSFTFTSPLVKPSAGTSRLAGKWDTRSSFNLDADSEKDASDTKAEGLSSVGLNFVNGDALSLLLERKLRELTSRIEPSINFIKADSFSPSTSSTLQETQSSSCDQWEAEHEIFNCSPSEDKPSECPDSCLSSTNGQVFRGRKLQVVEQGERSVTSDTRKKPEREDLSPLSVLEPAFLSESCWSSECSGSSDGSKACPSSIEIKNTVSSNFFCNASSIDTEMKLTDSSAFLDTTPCPKKSSNPELEYIREVIASTGLTAAEPSLSFLNQEGSALDPLLFDKLEGIKNRPSLGCRGDRRLLFNCISECLDARHVGYFRAGYAAWSKGTAALCRGGLENEIYSEISAWKAMGECMVDELVEKDMSTRLGAWVDFRIEGFEAGEEMEREILSSLLDEVIGDVCMGRRDCKSSVI